MPFNLGGPELFIILAIVLIVFGAGRLPNVMKDVGSGLREFKRAQSDDAAPAAPAALAPVGPEGAPPA
jgi:sec-independent protein translocase protein TatA